MSVERIDNNQQLLTDASAKLKLSPAVNDAINNGIKVHLHYQIRLKEENTYLLADSTLHTWVLNFSIKFHSLSNQYIVSKNDSDDVTNHLTINEALDHISSQLNIIIPIVNFRLNPEKNYYLSSRISIDKDKLPNLLKIYASINPTWNIKSPWFSWPIKPLMTSDQ